MIPVNLTLSTSATSPTETTDHFEIPEDGSTTLYLRFEDSDTGVDFQMRRRTRKRHKTSNVFDDWGSWTTWTEELSIREGAQRLSQTALTFSSSEINPAGFDLAEMELQAREAPEGEDEPEWSVSFLAKALFAPNITLSCTLTGADRLKLSFDSSWARNDNSIIIEDIINGYTEGPAALPSMLADTGTQLVFNRLGADGFAYFSVWNLTRHPSNSQYMTFVYRFATCDGQVGGIHYAPLLVTFAAANMPQMTLLPNTDEGYVEIFVTDGGGSKPITSATVLMLDGMGSCDLIPITLGQTARHYVPPLDVNVVYEAIVIAADGSRSTLTQTTQIASEGKLWLNWGNNTVRLASKCALDANINWKGRHSRVKRYFDTYSGYLKVFHGKARRGEFEIDGEVLYPRDRETFENLSQATKCVFREPYGSRRSLSIDSVDLSDAAANIQTNISISATQVVL
jgi:hypothetical protein